MQVWVKYVLGFGLPLFAFMVMRDTAGGFYAPDRHMVDSYVINPPEREPAPEAEPETAEALVEPEDAPVVELAEAEEAGEPEVPAAEEPVAEVPVAEEAVAEEAPAEDAATEEPVLEDTAAEEEPAAQEAVAEEVPAEAPMDEARLALIAAGESAARTCSSCHQLERERNGVGPHLVGLANRPIGGVDSFRYSSALQDLNAEGAVWTEEELIVWLANPSNYAPGTAMGYAVNDPEDRAAIAAWLISRDAE